MSTLPPETNDDPSPDDVMLDVLLVEALGGAAPKDQTSIILERLRAEQSRVVSAGPERPLAAPRKPVSVSESSRRGSGVQVFAVAAAVLIAAGLTWLVSTRQVVNKIQIQANAESDTQAAPFAPPAQLQPSPNSSETEPASKPRPKPIRLAGPATQEPTAVGAESPGADATNGADAANMGTSQDPPSQPAVAKAVTVDQASTLVSRQLKSYWKRIGVEVAPSAPAPEIIKRLSSRLGVKVSRRDLSSPAALRKTLSQEENANQLATRLVSHLIDGNVGTQFQQAKAKGNLDARSRLWDLIDQLQKAIMLGHRADEMVAGWLESGLADSPGPRSAGQTASWATLMQGTREHNAIGNSAMVLHGADLRCVRCHDQAGMQDGWESQASYWQFASRIRPYLDPKADPKVPVFYDTIAGERKAILGTQENSLHQEVIGSRDFAAGLVRWVWQMVHGRDLIAGSYEIHGSVQDDTLRSVQDMLVDDVLANRFDILRCINMVLWQSPIMRAAPKALGADQVAIADDQRFLNAVNAVDSFAASRPDAFVISQPKRVAIVREATHRRLGLKKFQDSSSSVLAQVLGMNSDVPGDSDAAFGPAKKGKGKGKGKAKGKVTRPRPVTTIGLPYRSLVETPAWLDQLPDLDSRLEHLAFLSRRDKLPVPLADLAKLMSDGGMEDELILEQLWWALQK